MSPRIIIVILSLLAPLAHCAMTVGWKIPVDRVATDLATNELVRKLAQPPASSAFFQPGDELWDISAALMLRAADPLAAEPGAPSEGISTEKWPGEWLVWNARSGMIIARGSKSDILFAQSAIGLEKLPQVIRTQFDLVRGTAETKSSMSVVGLSGMVATADIAPWQIEVAPVLSDEYDIIDERVTVTWTDGAMRWEISTGLTLHHGERTRLASQGSGEQRWELFITPQCEYFHGVNITDVRWQESTEGLVRWPIPSGGDPAEGLKAPEGLKVVTYDVPPNFLELVGSGAEKVTLPEFQVPASLGRLSQGKMTDVQSVFRDKGIPMTAPGSFAGYDPGSDRIVFAGSATDQELMEQLLESGCGPCIGSTHWVETDLASGGWGLACRSGVKAMIHGKAEDKELLFEIEPTIGGNDTIVDLHFYLDLVERLEKKGSLQSSVVLHPGAPQVIGSRATAGQDEQKVTLTVRRNLPVKEAQDGKAAPGH